MNRSGPLVILTLALTACGASPDPTDGRNYDAIDGTWTLTDRLTPQSLTPDGVNTLYYERALTATSAWGPIEVDRSNGEQGIGDGKTLTLNGVKYTKGYGVHAPSELKYSLAGTDHAKCVRFKAQIGLDDEVGNKGSAVFQIWGDTGKLFDSGVMTGASATRQVNVNLRGQTTLRMVVTDGGNGKSFDHADWINPTITCVPDITASVPETTEIYQDTHGTIPLTLTNRSASFKGDLTYKVSAYEDEDNFAGARVEVEPKSIRLNGAGVTSQALSTYVGPDIAPGTISDPHQLPDTLVIFSGGEEVTRVLLGVSPLAQFVGISFPDEPFALRVGETRTVQAKISIEPGGETTGPELYISTNPDPAVPKDFYEVQGSGEVPKEGGTLPVTIKLVRAPNSGEPNDFDALLAYSQNKITSPPYKLTSSVKLRYVP
ncbi:NPCBM/NEW2 domain-containing protein [Deinococcus oregonensis]|uniref:NPCBM/NEW2 domain-containing protein n=1 Tax=Deinococcus oregonensis TaxID=1805970 RepID=A0ABV6B3W7_9DEIO